MEPGSAPRRGSRSLFSTVTTPSFERLAATSQAGSAPGQTLGRGCPSHPFGTFQQRQRAARRPRLGAGSGRKASARDTCLHHRVHLPGLMADVPPEQAERSRCPGVGNRPAALTSDRGQPRGGAAQGTGEAGCCPRPPRETPLSSKPSPVTRHSGLQGAICMSSPPARAGQLPLTPESARSLLPARKRAGPLSFQKEMKENKTDRPLFLIRDNGFSKALRSHLSAFPSPR